jgi:hypothetical protein
MSIVDKVIAAVARESDEDRAQARAKARSMATDGDWLSQILDHHLQLENAFAATKAAETSAERLLAQKWLGVILTGHAIAEEAVIYPALTQIDEKGHATMGYTEQSIVKTQMAELETLDPMSQEYLDKLEHIRSAVAHHMYEEEGTWFIDLKEKLSAADQARLTERYMEEFDRYVGEDTPEVMSFFPSSAQSDRPDGARRI